MRVFKNKPFERFADKAGITDATLLAAIDNVSRGLIDADLGGGVIKQRIARSGGGKSGGFRTIILFKAGSETFFVHGFAKNERDNITPREVQAFKRLAVEMLAYDSGEIALAVKRGLLVEVLSDD